MTRRVNFPSAISLTRAVIWTIVLGYAVALVGRSMVQNYAANRTIAQHKSLITGLEKQKREQELALTFYTSNAFYELEARRRLNLRGPDEKVAALKVEESAAKASAPLTASPPPSPAVPAWRTWRDLFFGTKKTTESS